MAQITLSKLRHSYVGPHETPRVWALEQIDVTWEDGGAYALLGPSGCGKSTLLNIVSGLLEPTEGQVLFDGVDVTHQRTEQRNIAQVFQFPVVYDTMTVYENLAFPLRNRGVAPADIKKQVMEIAEMLELVDSLERRASGLTADAKQKISLGRGLVRSDFNAIMFDEPLTVIDPHLKWQLRSKLRYLHKRFSHTMIYVTHDQTEALTFADRVVVMHDGEIVQVGTSEELFDKPHHTFVGYFIGSPGMNVLPCTLESGKAMVAGHAVKDLDCDAPADTGRTEVGVRPEFVSFDTRGVPVAIKRVDDIGRYRIVEVALEEVGFKMLVREGDPIPSENPRVVFEPGHTGIYADGWLVQ